MVTADLLLHPVRLRVLQALLDGRALTTMQLRAELTDIPPATLYRHVSVLADAGLLEVVAETQIRGTVERTYQLRQDRARIDATARAAMTHDDHLRAFTVFVAGLLGDFKRYLSDEVAEPTTDGVTYQQAAVWLTDAELDTLLAEIRGAVTARAGHEPGPGRVRRMLSLIVIPTGAGSAPPT